MAAMDFKKMMQEERWAMLQEEAAKRDAKKMDQQQPIAVQVTSTELQPVPCNEGAITYPELKFQTFEFLPMEVDKIDSLNSLSYCEDCIDETTEAGLLRNIQKQALMQPWKQLRGRKLQCLGNFPQQVDGDDSAQLSTEMPAWLAALIDGLVTQGIFTEENKPDNVLINRYEAHEGILHHTDGPAYHDTVAILSLGSDCVLSFRHNLRPEMIGTAFAGDVCSVLLQRRSLFVFEKEAYADYMHGIAEDQPVQVLGTHGPCVNFPDWEGDKVARGTRTSITFRKLKPLSSPCVL